MIRAENLVKEYAGKKVVDNVSFQLEAGAIMVLLGESGSGKTTTMKMINRLVPPTSGKIWIDGQDTSSIDTIQLRRKMGYVIQENGLFPHYTVEENIAIVPRLLNWSSDRIEPMIEEVLLSVELPAKEVRHKYPHELSGGQQQRVAIARAIAAQPPLLLMDEPFSALDPITRTGVRASFHALVKRQQITVVLVTHDVAEAIELGDQICLMRDGKIIQKGTAQELIFQPADTFVASFFDHSRLESELKVVRLAEVLAFLPSETPLERVPADLSIYEAFDQYSDLRPQLLAAFYQFKNKKQSDHG